MRKLRTVACFAALLYIAAPALRSAEPIPDRLSDIAFWNLMESISEPDGIFPSENFVSNEMKYSDAIGDLLKVSKSGGVYLGVGPEQNFSYVAALQPKIAFIVDIRRQNLVEHLMYKALFEMSANRAEFLSRLFSRKLPSDVGAKATPVELRAALVNLSPNPEAFRKNLEDIQTLLTRKHGFALTKEDETALEKIYKSFSDFGPAVTYQTGSAAATGQAAANVRPNAGNPTYGDLMTAVDSAGMNWSYLAAEDSYQFVRDMEMRNLIVPAVGDFGGPKAIRKIGEYLKEHGETVTTFYVSNVEAYLFISTTAAVPTSAPNGGWKRYFENVSMLPLDASSVFVRFQGAVGQGSLVSISDNLKAVQNGSLSKLGDLYKKPN